MKNLNKGFTLAEILAVLVILGVVAALTIPSTLHRTSERANKTRIRKAMTVYETAVEKMIIENNIPRTTASLTAFALGQNNDCAPITGYFKVGRLETPGNNCRFRASDGLWWDVTDIANTMVSFKQEDLKSEIAGGSEYKAFKLATTFDSNASYRINDKSFAENSYNPQLAQRAAGENPTYYYYVNKTYAYLHNEQYKENQFVKYSKRCTEEDKHDGKYYNCTSYSRPNGVIAFYNCWNTVYNDKGQDIGHSMFCSNPSNPTSYTNIGTNLYYANGTKKENFDDCNFEQSYCSYIGFTATNGTTNCWYGGQDCSVKDNKFYCKKGGGGRQIQYVVGSNESREPCPDEPNKQCFVFTYNQDEYTLVNDIWAPKN